MAGLRTAGSRVLMTRVVALLFLICLAECAAEQRINTRGSNTPTLVDKGNGWRGQRGGSCLSYGHSCWGAHGKRSGNARGNDEDPPRSSAHLSDWYLAKLLRRMSGGRDLFPARNLVPVGSLSNNDLNAIFRTQLADKEQDFVKLLDGEESPSVDVVALRRDETLPLDDEPQVKAKLLQIVRDSDDK